MADAADAEAAASFSGSTFGVIRAELSIATVLPTGEPRMQHVIRHQCGLVAVGAEPMTVRHCTQIKGLAQRATV